MDKLLLNLKEVLIPILASLGITFLTSNEDQIHMTVEVNALGFYLILIALTWFTVWSLNRVWRRIKTSFNKFQAKNYEAIKHRCDGESCS